MTKKAFDCVEMKHQGAQLLQEQLQGMTPGEEIAFWRQRTQALKDRQNSLRSQDAQELRREPAGGTR